MKKQNTIKKITFFGGIAILAVLFVIQKSAEHKELPQVSTEIGTQRDSEEGSGSEISESPSKAADTDWCVVLDAGHGATDSGKVGINGALEKDINLSIVLKLREYLEQQGVMVVLTRVDDSPLYQESDKNRKLADMNHRLATMEAAKPDAVVSIHQNSYTSESAHGPQVFYYTTSTEAQKLAQALQDCFDLVIGEEANKRVIKANKDYYLLVHTPYTIVICECGFLSNRSEADMLVTEEYQDRIAQALSVGILNYLQTKSESSV
ncbi:MAG: N-acetylmuramoyl-L-alanine amidase [Lachnospiraceae bacterium]